MPRYKLTIEYDGAPFCGWQTQADQLTVQGVLTHGRDGADRRDVLVQGAGRTDAGVHARGQVAHIDLARDWETDTVRDALNAHLSPHPVAVLSAEQRRRRFQRPHVGGQAALSLPHHQPPARSHLRSEICLARGAQARMSTPCTRRRSG